MQQNHKYIDKTVLFNVQVVFVLLSARFFQIYGSRGRELSFIKNTCL